MSLPSPAPLSPRRVLLLATGGTIAGRGADAQDTLGYRAAQQGVEALRAALPALGDVPLETEQLSQIDSKDMGALVWRPLLARCVHHLARPELAGLVLTHGTDTLEETAWLLHRVLAPVKPLLLTAAMRPPTALGADGPGNLLDAVRLAARPGLRGVMVVMGGEVFGAEGLRKRHPQRLAAFVPGEAGLLAELRDGLLRQHRPWPGSSPVEAVWPRIDPAATQQPVWPRVEVLSSHADADGALMEALLSRPLDPPLAGVVVAGTGNGTLHAGLEAALRRAQAAGLAVVRSTRLAEGVVMDPAALTLPPDPADLQARDPLRPLPLLPLSPWQARVELQLRLLQVRFSRGKAAAAQAGG